MPLQTSVNAKLGQSIRSAYVSTVISFFGAVILTAAVFLATAKGAGIPFAEIAREPFWIWLGGLCGVVLVIISIVSLPKLGSTETMVMYVLGQIFAGLGIDSLGLFKSEQISLTVLRFAGFMLVLAGAAAVAKSNDDGTAAENSGAGKWVYRFAAIIAGMCSGIQVAVNGRLGVAAGNPFGATLISMTIGFILSILVVAALYLKGGRKSVFDETMHGEKLKWWMCTGGVFAIIIVGGNVIIAQILGTGLSLILNITGQTFGGVVVDAVGFLGIEKKPVTLIKVLGIIVMIAGIVLVNNF